MVQEAVELFTQPTRKKSTVQDENRETTAPLAFWRGARGSEYRLQEKLAGTNTRILSFWSHLSKTEM